jgi:hypothetical protein
MKTTNLCFYLIIMIFLLLGSCATRTPRISSQPGAGIYEHLYVLEKSRVDIAYVDPTVDYSRYSKVLVQPLNFDETEIVQPPQSSARLYRSKFELDDNDKAEIDKRCKGAMVEYLQNKGSFAVVDRPGQDVLTLSVSVLEIKPNAPKDDLRPGSIVYTESTGSMTMSAVLSDSVSGKPVAMMVDDIKDRNDMWGVNNRVTNLADVSIMFASWARVLNSSLEQLRDIQSNN